MAVTPTGVLCGPVDEVANLIAASPAFQTQVGFPGSAANAKTKVYGVARAATGFGALPYARPFALVTWQSLFVRRGGFGRGVGWFMFEAEPSAEYRFTPAAPLGSDPQSAAYEFGNWVGAVLAEMMIESEKGGRLIVPEDGIKLAHPIQRSLTEEGVDYFQAAFTIEFGGR